MPKYYFISGPEVYAQLICREWPTESFSVSQGAPLGYLLLALACPIQDVSLWVGFLYLMPGSEPGVIKQVFV